MNLYAYVGNNAINYSDPLGLYSWREFGSDVGNLTETTIYSVESVWKPVVNFFNEVDYIISCSTKLLINKKAHYDRNKHNKIPANAKETFIKQPESRNMYHNHWTSWNVKYISKDWHNEVVYDKKGDIVTDDENMWTYNYWDNDLEHIFEDMLPYYVRGNSENDKTKWRNRITWRDDFQ